MAKPPRSIANTKLMKLKIDICKNGLATHHSATVQPVKFLKISMVLMDRANWLCMISITKLIANIAPR